MDTEENPPSHDSHQFSLINFGTIAAFLAWFGGMGYLLTAYSTLWFVWGLGLATLTGLGGASLLFLFVSRVLMSGEQNLNPADYDMIGVLGRICSPVREGGTGEMTFVRDGARQTCGVRSEEGKAVSKGLEVVVTRFEKGIAYVRPWDELTGAPVSGCLDEPDRP
jgi:membrane protein implicated in regulation of membrane protease activity